MNLLGRAWQVVQANVNHWLTATEDPAQMLEQIVGQMSQELTRLRQGVAQAIATQKRTERQAHQNEAAAADWHQRAQLALNQGNEAIAREALTRRQTYLDTAALLRTQLQTQTATIAQLKQDLHRLETKYHHARLKRDMVLARLQSAQASQRLQTLLTDTEDSPWAMFDKVEAQILDLEAQRDVTQLGTSGLEARFQTLEQRDRVEAELNRLKLEQDKP
ncbi:PspA/IM30 family protein [Spirulina major CS-329]|jgi:phage shock protein A|uniref:PspA/IM30 family protein n=1 Tax=Spirulina TaxID=1154 RepID=UPI00232EFD7B|nr:MULTISPECIES: PspA/IM30 family protein [Spirulina]MDB9496561.1 PspA/IM30 family protein [Spirulina subsalsa CS-330]MDB9504184.1 PspA/IM30 family protein [Spirulina major CS-329]